MMAKFIRGLNFFRAYHRIHGVSIPAFVLLGILSTVITLFDAIGMAIVIPLLNFIAVQQGMHENLDGMPDIIVHVQDFLTYIGIPESPVHYILVIFGATVAKQVLYYFQRKQLLWLMQEGIYEARVKLFSQLMRSKKTYFETKKSGTLVNHLDRECYFSGTLVFSFIELLRVSLITGFYLILLIYISPEMTLFSIATVLLIMGSAQLQVRQAAKYSQNLIDENNTFRGAVAEYVDGYDTIRTFGKENEIEQQFNGRAQSIAHLTYKHKMSYSLMRVATEPVSMACLLATIYFGFIVSEISFPTFVGFLSILVKLSLQVSEFNTFRIDFASNLKNFLSLQTLFGEIEKESEPDAKKEFRFHNQISLKNIDFSYDGNTHVLKDLNLNICKGQTIGVIGSSGSGKTTLIEVLCGSRIPDKGEILIDELVLDEAARSSYEQVVSVVSQDVFLFDQTVRDNILFGLPDQKEMSEKTYQEIVHYAGLEDFLNQENQGDLKEVGERGSNLSGGQKQRVAIARALMAQKQILILDEATSALDSETERRISQTVKDLPEETTTIMISHRPNILVNCDVIYQLNAGSIAASYDSDPHSSAFEKMIVAQPSYKVGDE